MSILKPKILKVRGVNYITDQEPYEVTIRLTNNCNFSCSYCGYYDNHKSNETKQLLSDQIETLQQFIINLVYNFKSYVFTDKVPYMNHRGTPLDDFRPALKFYIHGGEPTIHANFFPIIELIDQLSEKFIFDYTINVQTNASQKDKFFKKLDTLIIDRPNLSRNLKFIASFQEHQNTTDQYSYFCYEMVRRDMLIGADIMLEDFKEPSSGAYDNIIFIYKLLLELRSTFKQKYIIQTNTINSIPLSELKEPYNKEYQKIYNEKLKDYLEVTYSNDTEVVDYDHFITSDENNFKMFKCLVGLKSILVDLSSMKKEDFGVYNCFTDYNKKHIKLDYEQMLNSSNIKLLINPTLCIHSKCICELQIPKVRIGITDAE